MPNAIILNVATPAMVPLSLGLHLPYATCHIYYAEYYCLNVNMAIVFILNVTMPAMVPLRLGLLLSFATCPI